MEYTDMIGRVLELPKAPQRIVSVVPSQTELLYDLGLTEQVVGITKFCVHPTHWFREKNRVGGTKQLNIEKIHSLNPDLVIANKEENTQSDINQLNGLCPVWVSDIKTLPDALFMIQQIGDLTNRASAAADICQQITKAFSALRPAQVAQRVAYLIWRKPWMVAGGDTFIHEMISKMGWNNVFAARQRYPEVTLDELVQTQPDIVLLSSEPYPFAAKHVKELIPLMPRVKIQLVDGEMFSWYGSRLLYVPGYFQQILDNA